MPLNATIADLERFTRKTLRSDNGCWAWTACTNNNGYGSFMFRGKTYSAHSFIYQVLNRTLTKGEVVDHGCNNPNCVNPKHLEAMTQRDNVMKSSGIAAKRARQTHCIYGHEFGHQSPHLVKSGRRACATCHRQREARRRSRYASTN